MYSIDALVVLHIPSVGPASGCPGLPSPLGGSPEGTTDPMGWPQSLAA